MAKTSKTSIELRAKSAKYYTLLLGKQAIHYFIATTFHKKDYKISRNKAHLLYV